MRGRVLGCSGSDCVITDDSGNRYAFTLADWKGSRPPTAREEVDFVAAGDKATQVFPVQAGPALAVQGLDGDAGRKALAVLRDRPQAILAAILLAAVFLFTFIQVKALGQTQWSATAFALPGKVGTIRAVARDGLKAQAAMLAQASTTPNIFGQPSPSTPAGLPAAEQTKLDQVNGILTLSQFVVLIYLLPLGAAAILFFEYRQRRQRMVELATGIVALLCIAAAFYARGAAAQMVDGSVGTGSETFNQAFQLGFGGWLIAACGVGLIATGLGYLRRTPGLPG